MHLRSLRLRNYRVYRAADIEFPDGLVGIYGPNGAGKRSIIESVRYALYGDARTEKSELRTAGINEDVRVELVFEHEGNSYEVRRVLKGRNLTPTVEVYVNRQLAAQSARDANAYLGRVLGMDQRAFLASVCAQQKELTTFATMVPSERRRLVLDLLGVSPIERALVHVREEARDARTAAGGARAQLPDLPAAESAAAVAAGAAGAEAETAATALAAAEAEAATAEAAARKLDELRQLVALARAEAASARGEAERHERRALAADALAPELEAARARHAELEAAAAPLPALAAALEAHLERQGLLRALQDAGGREQVARRALAEAERESAAAAGLIEARDQAEAAVEEVEGELAAMRERHAHASELLGAAAARLEAATAAA